ncbi:MAG TPA: DMT family transporter [Streptosporangiaceae bacterium]|nr:DMT family transporter [Streptosporangiaceae bacterium]
MAGSVSGVPAQALAIALAVIGAFSYAIASVYQQQTASKLATKSAFDPAVLVRLVRKRRWLLGLIGVAGGYGFQAAALDVGRLVVVEPVFPIGLLFALLLAARAEGRRLRHAEWTAAIAAVAGLAVFLVAAQPSGGHRTAGAGPLGVVAAGAVVIALLCSLAATRVATAHRALVLSIGGGIGAGVTDALTKTVAALVGTHKLGIFGDVRLYLLAVVGLLTFTMQQNAFRAAGLSASLPSFAVLEPIVGSLLGLAIYHEQVGGGGLRIAVEVLAVLAAIWGIARLASSVIAELARLAAAATPPPDPAA